MPKDQLNETSVVVRPPQTQSRHQEGLDLPKYLPYVFTTSNIAIYSEDNFRQVFCETKDKNYDSLMEEIAGTAEKVKMNNHDFCEMVKEFTEKWEKKSRNDRDSSKTDQKRTPSSNTPPVYVPDDTSEVIQFRQRCEALEKKMVKLSPPKKVFEMICEHLRLAVEKSNVEYLKRRYQNISVKYNYNPDKYFNHANVDHDPLVELSREEVMESYHRLLCPKCFTYNCQTHLYIPIPYIFKEKTSTQLFGSAEGCGDNCAVNRAIKNQDFYMADSPEWTPTERTMFLALTETFPNNPCAVSKILKKECNEVRLYTKLQNLSPVSPPQVNPGRSTKLSNPVHKSSRKVRMVPCIHPGTDCTRLNNCPCKDRSGYCGKLCNCRNECKNRFRGCTCKPINCRTIDCPCFTASRECDPDLCKNCTLSQAHRCLNMDLQRGLHKHLMLAVSTIPNTGWGIFTKEFIAKDEFVYEYCGEIVDKKQQESRDIIYEREQHTFVFELNDAHVLDAIRIGNKMRFANHSKRPNCAATIVMVNDECRIAIHGRREINIGEELFLDYREVLQVHSEAKRKREEEELSSPGPPSPIVHKAKKRAQPIEIIDLAD